jgi:hypothetical protein
MDLNVTALEMLSGEEAEGLAPCLATCLITCFGTCLDTAPVP